MDFHPEEMQKGWFGSSVGLEQQPSKLRVKGSSPFRITKGQESKPPGLLLLP